MGVGFGDFGNVFVGVWVVDFVQGDDGGEFYGDEGGYHGANCGAVPCFQGGFETEEVEGVGYGRRGGAVAGELVLEGVNGSSFCILGGVGWLVLV